jgi:hypothetical protein
MAVQAFPLPGADGHEIRPRLGGDGLAVGVGAILVIARMRSTAIVRANTRFAPTEGGWSGDGVCPSRTSLYLFHRRGITKLCRHRLRPGVCAGGGVAPCGSVA